MRVRHLENDTVINVAQLLKAPVGTERYFTVHLDELVLDSDLAVAMSMPRSVSSGHRMAF
jgi:hypothetical protein